MDLRLAHRDDAPALAALARRAFIAKFGALYSTANLNAFLDATHSDARWAADLADPRMAVALVGDAQGPAAFCKIVYASTLPRHGTACRPFEIKQLYADPARTGQGLGARLMDWAMALARTSGADAVELSVYADNPAAHRFYARYGFAKIADITFVVGDHVDPEWLMACPLADAGVPA